MALNGSPRRTVLIGFGEALAAPEVAMSLVAAGHDVRAFFRRGSRAALRRHPLVTPIELPAPEERLDATLEQLVRVVSALEDAVLMPLDDPSVLVTDLAFDGDRRTAPLIAGPLGEHAALALDKVRQLRSAEAAGFAVPAWEAVAPADLAHLDLPVIAKPRFAADVVDGRLRRLSPRLVRSEGDAQAVARSWGDAAAVIAQHIVAGRGAGVFGLADGGESHHLSAHERIRMMNPVGSGSSACRSVAVTDALVGPVERLVRTSGWTGLFMVEVLCDDEGTCWFMELNGRPWGSMALARRAGFDYPAWAVARCIDPHVQLPPAPAFESVVCRNLGRELVHVAFVLRGRDPAASSWPARARASAVALRPRRGDRWYNWSRDFPSLVVRDAWQTVRQQLRGGRV